MSEKKINVDSSYLTMTVEPSEAVCESFEALSNDLHYNMKDQQTAELLSATLGACEEFDNPLVTMIGLASDLMASVFNHYDEASKDNSLDSALHPLRKALLAYTFATTIEACLNGEFIESVSEETEEDTEEKIVN